MGETMIRFRAVRPRRRSGSKSIDGSSKTKAESLSLIAAFRLIVAFVGLRVRAIRDGVEKPQDVLSRLRIEAIQQNGVGSSVISEQLELRIVDYDVAVVFDAEFAAHLQNDPGFILRRFFLPCYSHFASRTV
jgi:hypothetical protein